MLWIQSEKGLQSLPCGDFGAVTGVIQRHMVRSDRMRHSLTYAIVEIMV